MLGAVEELSGATPAKRALFFVASEGGKVELLDELVRSERWATGHTMGDGANDKCRRIRLWCLFQTAALPISLRRPHAFDENARGLCALLRAVRSGTPLLICNAPGRSHVVGAAAGLGKEGATRAGEIWGEAPDAERHRPAGGR